MLALLLACLQISAAGEAHGSAAAQRAELHLGSEFRGELPAKGASSVAPEFVLELELHGAEPITLQGSSLDFDLALSVEDTATHVRKDDRNSWPQYNAWLVWAPEGPARLTVRVTAEDGRGGEFLVLARAGGDEPPADRRERILAAIAQCAAIAVRAEQKGDLQRAARHAGVAAEACFLIDDYVGSAKHAERELAIAERAALELETARAQLNLGAARRMLGENAKAEALLLSAKPTLLRYLATAENEATKARNARLACFLCDNLGDLLRDVRGPAAAQPVYEEEVALVESINDPRFQVTAWLKLADNSAVLGDRARAQLALANGLGIAEASKDPDLIATAMLTHGRVLLLDDRPEAARDVLARGLELARLPMQKVDILGTLTSALLEVGRYEEAESRMDELEALASAHAFRGYDAKILAHRADIAYALGDVEGALRLAELSLAEAEDHGTALDRAEARIDLGDYHSRAGRPEIARAFLADAGRLLEAAETPHLDVRVHLTLGAAEEAAGELAGAERSFSTALRLAAHSGNELQQAAASAGLAYVLWRAGAFTAARAEGIRAAAELERLGDSARALDAYDTLAKAALGVMDLGGAAECLCRAEEHVERLSAGSADVLRKGSLRSRFASWGAIAQDVEALRRHRSGSDEGALADGWQLVQRWKARVLLEHMSREPSSDRDPLRRDADRAARGVGLPHVGAASALIEYTEGLETLYVYVWDGRSLRLLELGRLDEIEPHAREFTRLVQDPTTDQEDWAREGALLYRRLIEPATKLLDADVTTLVVIPSPAVSLLPFEALVQPESAEPESGDEGAELSHLIDKFSVVYAPSPGLLEEPGQHKIGAREPRFLILGDPLTREEYEGERGRKERIALRASDAIQDLVRLKKTREETLEVASVLLARPRARERIDAQLYQRFATDLLELRLKRSGALETPAFDLWLGSEASSHHLGRDLTGYTDLHLACHGWIDPRESRHSGLVLSYEPSTSGLLPLSDLSRLKLDADLVVLSACESAKGRVVHGEGVQSVAYALLLAGARGVIASLWKVEDGEAAELMKAFYNHRFASGAEVDAATALRRVKLEMRRSHALRGVSPRSGGPRRLVTSSHPYFWAAFVYLGTPP